MTHRIVAVTPAGRRRYMRLLVPYILSSPCIDRYDIWVNTVEPNDLAFLEALEQHDKINLIPQPDGIVKGTRSINAFFHFAQEPDEIYVRFDDDVIWMKPGTIEKIVEFRKSNPEYFLVAPYIINNAICTALLQAQGHLLGQKKVQPYCLDEHGWRSPEFAEKLHRVAIQEILSGKFSEFSGSNAQVASCRFSINCISWFGADLNPYEQIFSGLEEIQISYVIPTLANRANAIIGDTLVSHFAFFTQREHLDTTDILDAYLGIRNDSDWLSADAVEFVESAYKSVSQHDVDASRNSAIKPNVSLLERNIRFPSGIKTRKTSIASILQKASTSIEKLYSRGR